jgi:hypothetical protein
MTKPQLVAATHGLAKRTRNNSLRQLVLKGILIFDGTNEGRYTIAGIA